MCSECVCTRVCVCMFLCVPVCACDWLCACMYRCACPCVPTVARRGHWAFCSAYHLLPFHLKQGTSMTRELSILMTLEASWLLALDCHCFPRVGFMSTLVLMLVSTITHWATSLDLKYLLPGPEFCSVCRVIGYHLEQGRKYTTQAPAGSITETQHAMVQWFNGAPLLTTLLAQFRTGHQHGWNKVLAKPQRYFKILYLQVNIILSQWYLNTKSIKLKRKYTLSAKTPSQ